MLHS
jgi:hypothetical protein